MKPSVITKEFKSNNFVDAKSEALQWLCECMGENYYLSSFKHSERGSDGLYTLTVEVTYED